MVTMPPQLPPYTPPPVPTTGPPPPPPLVPSPAGRALREFWTGQARPASASTLVLVATSGVLGGLLLVGHRPGLGVPLVGVACWAAAWPLLRRRPAGVAGAALSVALLAVLAVRDAPWLGALCVLASLAVAAVTVSGARSGPAVLMAPATALLGMARAVPWVRHAAGARTGGRKADVLALVRGLGLAVGALVVFGFLFAGADRIVAGYLGRVDVGTLPARVVVGGLVALVAATLVHLVLAPPSWRDVGVRRPDPARRAEWYLPVLTLDAVVVAFVVVQVGATSGGHRDVLEGLGLSYAQYARQGFGQLLVATALTVVVVTVAARRAPTATATDRRATTAALAVLCVASLGVVASALHRMDLYVDAFGLTRLRVLAVLAELVLAALLVLVLVAGLRRAPWLPRAAVGVVAVSLLALAAVNPDGLVARHNLAADLEIELDRAYLAALSSDAVPELSRAPEPLRSCLLQDDATAPPGPADWNLGRARASAVLAARPVEERDPRECFR